MAAGSSNSQAQASVSSLLSEAIRILSEQQPEQPVASRSERVAENFRRCFPSLGGIRSSPYSAQRPRRGNVAPRRPFFVPNNTWTHDICVLALVNEEATPNRDRLDQLKSAGLGKKRIAFNKNGDHAYFIKKLEEEFPQLQSQQGAIEVLRSTGGGAGIRPITPIPMGSQGYCIKDLRSSINSAILYVRSLQTDLNLEVIQDNRESPRVTCVHCGKEVSLPDLRAHSQSLECSLARPCTSTSTSTVDLTSDETSGIHETDFEPGLCIQATGHASSQPVPSCTGTTSSSGKLAFLQEMFPSVPADTLSEVARTSATIDDAVEELVRKPATKTLEEVLREYRENTQATEEINITVERENIWCHILAFYKKALNDKERLKKKLVVSFEGEEGIDAGALSAEFSQLALDQIKKRLFQGKVDRVIPIKDSTKLMLFRIAGMVLGHSLLHHGPCFPVLCPAVYYYLVGKCEDVAIHLNKEDIPLTAGSEAMVNLIRELDECETADDLSNCLSDQHVWDLISACHWPNEVCVTLQNKATLVSHMVEQEVLWSRKQELDDFGAGMESLGLLTLLRRNPDVCMSLLCNGENGEFGPEEFEQCLSRPDVPDDFVQAQAYEWFNVYIAENPNSESFQGGCRLKALLHFSTGYQVPPPGQSLPHKVSISFLPDDDQHQLPIAQACFGYLRLPTVHSSLAKFSEFMDMALRFEGTGFSVF